MINRRSTQPAINSPRHLSVSQALSLANAFLFAEATNRPLGLMITATWRDFRDANQHQVLRAIRKLLNYHGLPCAYVWVNERVRKLGVHTHIMIYADRTHRVWRPLHEDDKDDQTCDDQLQDDPTQDDKMCFAESYLRRHFDCNAHALRFSWRDTRSFTESLDYVLKGVSPTFAEVLGLRRCTPQGIINGLRAGVSWHTLGPKVRKELKWRNVTHVSLRYILNDPPEVYRFLPPPKRDNDLHGLDQCYSAYAKYKRLRGMVSRVEGRNRLL